MVTVDDLTFLDTRADQLCEYQIFSNGTASPPSYFNVKTDIGERGVVYDYVAGATLENGNYTYEISMKNDGNIVIVFLPD
jgi:hypothetical protein